MIMKISKNFYSYDFQNRISPFVPGNGFSLVEALVASVILAIAALATTKAFNVIIQSINDTGVAGDQNRRIDAQIATINELSELYTACNQPSGEIPLNPLDVCGGTIEPRSSFYYFPSYQDSIKVNLFFESCKSSTASNHITGSFVSAINDLPSPGVNVSEPVAARVNSDNPANHLVEVTWLRATGPVVLRQIWISPVVTSWCP